MTISRLSIAVPILAVCLFFAFTSCDHSSSSPASGLKPESEWGHWRLGHRPDFEFLETNKFTVTFGSGAPNFEAVTREEFDAAVQQSIDANKIFHDRGYIVLRYMTSSIHGRSPTSRDEPQKHQLDLVQFYNEKWEEFEDYIGPKPPESESPDTWITIRPNGTFPHYRYAPYGQERTGRFETWGCPNNPHFSRLMEGRIRSQAETGIDGVYIDWTHMAGRTCYCSYCEKNFRAYLSDNLPPDAALKKYGNNDYDTAGLPLSNSDPFWMEWVIFRGHTLAEFHKRLRTVARMYNPHFMISGNVYGGFGYGAIAYDAAGNMELFGRDGYHDFIYSEIQEYLDTAPRKNEEGVKVSNSPSLKFLTAAAHGKPVIVYATEITTPIFPNPTPECLGAMAQINIAESVANQAIFREKRETPPEATAIYNFLHQNETALVGAHKTGNLAILASMNQYFAREQSYTFSLSRILADEGIAHVHFIEDDILDGRIKNFDVIVLPYIPLLSTEKQNALVKYVENGGTLLILGKSGAKDEFNVPHNSIVLESLFPGRTYPELPIDVPVKKGIVGFIPLSIPESKFLVAAKEASEYTTFGPSMADVFADIPEGFTRGKIDPELHKVLTGVSEKAVSLLDGTISRLYNNTPFVELSVMLNKKRNRLLVHLVNYNVTIDGTITPARNTKVRVAVPDGKRPGILTFSGTLGEMEPVAYTVIDIGKRRVIEFEAQQVNIYGLGVLELK
jgi:hypothetical protein